MWNQIKTTILLASLSALLLSLGYLFGGTTGLHIAFFMALIMNGVSYFFSDKIVLNMYKATPLDKQQYAHIYTIVKDLAQRMQIAMPRLWLVNTPVANAFATGRNPNNASVAVTTGILSILDTEELRGVLAHELSHVKNRDILVSTIAATLATAIGYGAFMLRNAAFWGSYRADRDRNQPGPFTMILIGILMPAAASLLQLAISRSREYLADESGAQCTHEPLALASALEKLERNLPNAHFQPTEQDKASTASLFIVFPFTSNGILSWFSTHPPIAKRIARLREMAQKAF